MEKLKFTIRCIAALAFLPVIMYADLSRTDTTESKTEKKETPAEKVSTTNQSEYSLSCYFPFTQAVYN